ncbi:hypothetical protein EB796_016215 [Bugula neritina]|uniref:GTP cyclohydrolase 1 n=1 Tax=Bugula neritina TaxID=10212 RepID=A0A7J7JIM6_BUGNE|nr:hypothetical protein EB796_016215 [Bugula neritina]
MMTVISALQRRRSIVGKEQHDRLADMSNAVRCMLKSVGENPDREGLLKTPERAAKAFMFFTKGYEDSISGMESIFCSVKYLVCICS